VAGRDGSEGGALGAPLILDNASRIRVSHIKVKLYCILGWGK